MYVIGITEVYWGGLRFSRPSKLGRGTPGTQGNPGRYAQDDKLVGSAGT